MERMRDILDSLTRRGDELPAPLTPALAWTLAAGPALAGRAPCLDLRDGVLTVAAADASLRAQLQSVAPELRRALNHLLGAGAVQRLDLRS